MTCVGTTNAQGQALKVVIVQGQGVINNVGNGSLQTLEVQIRDENDKPVSGANVTFLLPERGPGGTFLGTYNKLNLATNDEGNAIANSFQPNLVQGRFQIHVIAAQGDRTGSGDISQTNVVQSKDLTPTGTASGGIITRFKSIKLSRRTKIIAGVAVGAIVVLAVTTGGGGSSTSVTSSTATSILPGTVAVGAPR
jgi:hypothetical protein